MDIYTDHPFGGKHFAGKIKEKYFKPSLPGISFTHFDAMIGNSEFRTQIMNVDTLTEMRDELNELIAFMSGLDPSSSKQPEENEIELDVKKCQRCGKDHKVRFRPLNNPIDNFTKWGICENTGQPVLLGTGPSKDEEKVNDNKLPMLHGGICDAKVITTSETGSETIVPLNESKPQRPACGLCHGMCMSEGILRNMNSKDGTFIYSCFNCATPYMYKLSPYKFEPYDKQGDGNE